ncbi:MAG: MFS transporter [Oscillospiraceae bacterium]|nr:MFS transporter [Oscillospiraceae bacterium]
MKKKLGARIWSVLILVGLSGQFAWTLENMYFNVFLYNTISTNPDYIAAMVAASAITATLTTLIMGALSDRVGKRKAFITAGYILWGITTAAFGFITPESAGAVFPAANAAAAAAVLVIIMDCLMTFFGSTANDAAFNAYVTDNVPNDKRGRTEGVLAILPLVSMLVVFGLFDGYTQRGEWKTFFGIFGIMVTLVGIISIFIVKDAPALKPRRDSYFKNLLYGLRPGVIKSLPGLYWAMLALCVFSIAVQVFFPYLIIYIQTYLGITDYAIVLGIVLIIASVVSVATGGIADKVGKLRFLIPAGALMLVGLVAMFFARAMAAVIICGCVMMSGYMMLSATLNGIVRDHTPEGKVGHFQGIRMIFSVMLPMIIGPFIGSAVIKNSPETYMEMGQLKSVPTPGIFLAAAITLLFVIIPFVALKKREKN